jgi:UMF1 family MFS transporter
VSETPRPTFLKRLALDRPELRGWAMYDWGNSAFFTTIVATIYPIYFRDVVGDAMTKEETTQFFVWASAAALAIIALVSPLLGAVADHSGNRKRWLAGFLVLGAGSVAGMIFIDRGDWLLAAILFGGGNIGAAGTMVFYDALLPHVAREDEIDRLSMAAYGLGYLGGGLLLAAQLALLLNPGWIGVDSNSTWPTRIALFSVSIWWLAFSVPLFRNVPEPPGDERPRRGSAVLEGLKRLMQTARTIPRHRDAFLMLIAFLIYADGIGTVFRMAALFADELGFDSSVIISALLLTQFVGVPAAFFFGWLSGRIGPKRAIMGALVVYVGACLVGSRMSEPWHMFVLAGVIALVQGGAQGLSRSLFASMVPRQKSAEFFGIFAVSDRVAGVAGQLLFGSVIAISGSTRIAVASVAIFFVVGGILLSFVHVGNGRHAAKGTS